MRIRRLHRAGFCFGVRRAVELALGLLGREGRVNTLGPLMHNPQEVARLAGLGIVPCARLEECGPGPVLVRTHGVDRATLAHASLLGLTLVDATCTHVLRARCEIAAFGRAGRTVILAGDAGHPEVQAQVSFAEGPIHVVAEPGDLPDLPPGTPVGLAAQTTLPEAHFATLERAVRARFRDTAVSRTLCDDARRRQAEAVALSRTVDAMVVVGGRNSANTQRLAEACRSVQPRCLHVESPAELRAADLAGAAEVGLAAGASTPDWLIDEVAAWLASCPGQPCGSKEKSIDTRGQSQ